MAQLFALRVFQDGQGHVDRQNGRIHGLSVITEGEASGHGMYVDEVSVQQLHDLVSGKSIPAYITHSGAIFEDRLTAEIGKMHNFYIDDDKLRADFEAFDSFREHDKAKYDRLFELAEKMTDRFGTSVVFSGYQAWATDNGDMPATSDDPPENARFFLPSVRFRDVNSIDFVDTPAANSGLFATKIDNPANKQMTKIELESKLSAIESDNSALSTKVEQLETEKQLVQGEVDTLSAKVTELEGQLSAKQDEANQAIADKDAEIEAINVQLAAKDARIAELEELVNGSDPVEANSDDPLPASKTFSRKERAEIISQYAKQNGISEFAATVKLGKERPELWGKK